MFKLPNGKSIQPGTAFTYNGIMYPSNWQRYTPEERAAIGIVELVEAPRPDDRYYWVDQQPDGSWSQTPKDLAPLKVQKVLEVKNTAAQLLAATDWQIVREWETVDQLAKVGVKDERSAIRANSNTLEAEINAMTTVDQLAAWQPSGWPVQGGI